MHPGAWSPLAGTTKRLTWITTGRQYTVIITVTVDSSMSYPADKSRPPIEDLDTIEDAYIQSVDSGLLGSWTSSPLWPKSHVRSSGRWQRNNSVA